VNGFPWGDFGLNLAVSAGVALAVMLVTFAIALVKGVHRIVDVAWGLGFTAVAAVTFVLSDGQGHDGRRLIVTVLTVVWGLRLSGHIALRGRGHGEDPRYARMLAKAPGDPRLYALRMVYLLQGALVWLVSLPVQAAQYLPGEMNALAGMGLTAWLVGFFFETVGDAQLARFKDDPDARDRNGFRIMDRGLWRLTRHPNYFGDFMVWWGLFLLACGDLAVAAVTVVAPVVMSLLLTVGSGKRLLERQLAERPGYAEYAARTSGFFPAIPRADGDGDGNGQR
jgi:steroid 5-alpha reductase family enzyme